MTMSNTDAEIAEPWLAGKLREACDVSARVMASHAHPFRGGVGDDDLATAQRWHDHGSRCWHLTRFDEAADALDRAYTIRSARLGVDHIDTLWTQERLAGLADYTLDKQRADAHWQHVITKLNDTSGVRGVRTAIARRNYSSALRMRQDLTTAHKQIELAHAVFRREVDPEDLEYLALRKSTAMLALMDRAYGSAIRLADEAFEYAPLDEDHPFVAAAELISAQALHALDRTPEARAYIERVIASFERGYGDHPMLAIAIEVAGNIERTDRDLEATRAHYERAFRMYRRFYPDSPSTGGMAQRLLELLESLGDKDAIRALEDELER
jgi:tetratricopeptide (TPR) repeat protein